MRNIYKYINREEVFVSTFLKIIFLKADDIKTNIFYENSFYAFYVSAQNVGSSEYVTSSYLHFTESQIVVHRILEFDYFESDEHKM